MVGHVCVPGRVWIHPYAKGRLSLQISELKNHGILRALTAEANGWEPGGKSPSGPLEGRGTKYFALAHKVQLGQEGLTSSLALALLSAAAL